LINSFIFLLDSFDFFGVGILRQDG